MAHSSPLVFREDILRGKAFPVKTAGEAMDVIDALEHAMLLVTGCMGLAAPQIGIQKAVGIIRHGNVAIDLINPVLVSGEGTHVSEGEGCMSYPGRKFRAERFSLVNIELDGIWADSDNGTEKTPMPYRCAYKKYNLPSDARLVRQRACFSTYQDESVAGGLVCIAVQHELDHLSGIVLPHRDKTVEIASVIASPDKIGRNDPCPCGSGKKYKKCCLEKT